MSLLRRRAYAFSLISASFLAFSAIRATPASAFLYLMGSNYLKGERPISDAPVWPDRNLRLVVNTDINALGGSASSLVTGAEILAAAQEAVAAWNAACRAEIHIELAGTTSGIYDPNDRVNTIIWDRRTAVEGNYYGNSTTTLAAATTVMQGSELADCDIVLNGNSSSPMEMNPATGHADLRSVITHEIGHCLGLDHPVDPSATPAYTSSNMYVNAATMRQTAVLPDPSDISRRDISQDDRDGIECIYERGKPLRSGLHCSSYSGTNGQGAVSGVLSGGPTVVDTTCGGDAQGRNANPSTSTGDGCAPAAIASEHGAPPSNPSPLRALGGSWGFILFAVAFHFTRRYYRRVRA